MGYDLKLAVQSYCFRGFKDNRKVAEMVKECGLDKIELCGVHVDFSNPSTFKEVIEIYRDAGIEIISIGVQGFANNEEKERKFFEFLKEAETKYMSVDFNIDTIPDCFKLADKLAEEYDVKLAIHNHGGKHWLGNSTALNYVFKRTSERIGLCLDTAWALDTGEDPVEMAERFKERLYLLHIKDFTFDTARRYKDVIAGEGNLDLNKLFNFLKNISFEGYGIIEYEADVENPVPAIKKCVEKVRESLSSL
ncbi:sugar phosphate isomerase/epimerase [bacterium]|nr:sugar phosphate isomerase/epimerase [bacterium]